MRMRVFVVAAALALCVPVALAANNRPAGGLDPSFGDKGFVSVRAGAYSAAADLVVQPDRKVVLAGIVSDGNRSNSDFLAVRLNRNGSRDRSFGNGGIVRTSVELGGMRRAELAAAARGPQGAIVLAGNAYKAEGGETDFAAVRLKPSGALDTSFSDDGVQTVDLREDDFLSGVAVQPDGKLVLVGSWHGPWPTGSGFIVIRLLPSGALDTSFGSGGVVDTKIGDPSDGDAAADVTVLGDGRIVVAGTVDVGRQWSYHPGTDFAVVRYLPDGRRDPTFGEDGIARTAGPSAENAADLVVTPDEMIVVVGNQGYPSQPRSPTRYWFYLARYLPTGALDPTFGAGGTLTTGINGGEWAYSIASSVAVEGDGKIIAGGVTGTYYPAKAWRALARFNEDGTPDHTFGVNGTRRYFRSDSFASAIGIQPLAARSGSDRLVMAGAGSGSAGSVVEAIGVDLGPPPPPVRCRVPRVVGLTLNRARARIRSAHCRVGRVRRAPSARRRGRVIWQRPRAGRRLPRGSRVGLVVSRGR